MKRWNEIAFLLLPAVLAAVLAGCAPAAESGDACVFAGGRSAVEAYAPDAAAGSGRMAFDRGGTVDYTYRLTYYEDDAARVGVELAFTVCTPSGEYALSAAEGVGCTLTGFRDDENARVMLTLQSNCGGFAPWDFPRGEWIGAYVHSFTIGLERTSDGGFIAGIEEIGLPGSGSTGAPYTGLGSAEEQLALLPAPYHAAAATAGAALAAAASPATVEIAKSMTHHRWVTATMDEADTLNLDAAPIPVVFQLGNSAETPVTFVGNAYGQITYAIDLWSAGFYIPTEVAAFPVAMTLR